MKVIIVAEIKNYTMNSRMSSTYSCTWRFNACARDFAMVQKKIKRVDPIHIGLLDRATEKLAENKT